MIGILAAFGTAFLASAKDLVSKKVSFTLPGHLSAFASFAFALPWYLLLLTAFHLLGLESFEISSAFLGLVLLRALTDTFAEYFKMESMRHGDISLLVPFLSLSPLFLLVTSPLITGDVPSRFGGLAVLVIVVGTVLSMSELPKLAGIKRATVFRGVLLATLSSLFFSLNSCFDRLSIAYASPAWSACAMTFVSALFIAPTLTKPEGVSQSFRMLSKESKFLVLRGIFETLFMVCKLTALQTMQAPYVVGLMKVSLLFSVFGGSLFFNERLTARRVLGGVLVLVGILGIVLFP